MERAGHWAERGGAVGKGLLCSRCVHAISVQAEPCAWTFVLTLCNSCKDGGRFLSKMKLSFCLRGYASKLATITKMEVALIQHRTLALAPWTFILNVCNNYRNGDRAF